MRRTLAISIQTMCAMAIVALAALFTPANTLAQDGPAYDMKVVSPADGNANEYPLVFQIEYDNGARQDVTIGGDGVFARNAPVGALNPIAIWFLGIRRPIANNVLCIPLPGGGCWCLCSQWINWRPWPWWWKRRLFWYFNPCC